MKDVNELNIINLHSNKVAVEKWKKFQTERSTQDWHSHLCKDGNVGIICGKISSNIHALDFDLKNDPTGKVFDDFRKQVPTSLLKRLIIQGTINGGFHLIFKCEDKVLPKQRVAYSEEGEVILELQGEGSYFCHHLKNYEVINGEFDLKNQVIDIPEITEEEFDLMMDVGFSLNRKTIDVDKILNTEYKEEAINTFNTEGQDIILALLEEQGIKEVDRDGQKIRLLRDGSFASHSGYYFLDNNMLYMHSSSTAFEPNKPYNNFQIVQVLKGNSDYRKTLRELDKLGYASSFKSPLPFDEISKFLNDAGVRGNEFIQDLEYKGLYLDESISNTLKIDLQKSMDRKVSTNDFETVLKSKYIDSYNPILDFVKKYESRKPNGAIRKWFDTIRLLNKEVDPDDLFLFVKKWYVGIISQALGDGSQQPNDKFISLISNKQGIGKTSFLKNHTIPNELQNYVAEYSMDYDDDMKLLMGQTLLVIDDESDGKTWNEQKTFKSVLSNTKITMRKKYERRMSHIKRRCSFCGSGNDLFVIREQENRRIIPIEVDGFDWITLNHHIDLIDVFMEAYWLYVDGFKYEYELSDQESLKAIYKDYIQVSDNQIILEKLLSAPLDEEDCFYVTAADLLMILQDWHKMKINNISLGRELKNIGIEKRKCQVDKNRKWAYGISHSSTLLKDHPDKLSDSLNVKLNGREQRFLSRTEIVNNIFAKNGYDDEDDIALDRIHS